MWHSCSMPQQEAAHLSPERDGQRQLAEQLLHFGAAPHFHRRQAVLADRHLWVR